MNDDREALRSLRSMIIDLDGVFYRGDTVIPGAPAFVDFLREQDIGFVLATNNSTRTPQQYVEKLGKMGVLVGADQILTSAVATAGYLASNAPLGTRVFVVGQDGLLAALADRGFALVEDNVEWVVAGMDFTICYERLAQAALHIRGGARFVGTNPDLTFPSERGIVPGAGSLLAFLEAATGIQPSVIGKPAPLMMEQALVRMDAQPETTAVLGDRLETDILAGLNAGLGTILVLSGVTDPATLAASTIQPDLVYRDVGHLHGDWLSALDG
jgi:4-nitrophenyl phosphatase